jgi:hypothetical protein
MMVREDYLSSLVLNVGLGVFRSISTKIGSGRYRNCVQMELCCPGG